MTRTPPTLEEMGLTKNESSRYQQLAAMPPEHFETAVATAKATAGEVTTALGCRSRTPSRLRSSTAGFFECCQVPGPGIPAA